MRVYAVLDFSVAFAGTGEAAPCPRVGKLTKQARKRCCFVPSTGWSKFLQMPLSTPFWKVRPCNFAHVFSVPLPSLQRMVFCFRFFFRQIFGVMFFWGGYLGLRDSTFFGEKKIK